jgi:hypothetical protein
MAAIRQTRLPAAQCRAPSGDRSTFGDREMLRRGHRTRRILAEQVGRHYVAARSVAKDQYIGANPILLAIFVTLGSSVV